MARYKSHARTLDELRSDFLNSVQARLDNLDRRLTEMKPSATEASRIARARLELLDLQNFWREVEIVWKNGNQIQ